MTSAEEIGNRLKSERQRLQMTQAEAAAICDCSVDMWGKYERGAYAPKRMTIRAFAGAGADEQYINTGVRSESVARSGPPSGDPAAIDAAVVLMKRTLAWLPTEKEERLLSAYRRAEGPKLTIFEALIEELAPGETSGTDVTKKVANGP